MARDSFVFYKSILESAECIPNAEDKAAFLEAVLRYGIYGEMPDDLEGVPKAMLLLCIPSIDKANGNHDKKVASGKLGAEAKQKKASKSTAEEKEEEHKTEAKSKQNKSKTVANNKQNKSVDEAEEKQTVSKTVAEQKQEESKAEANAYLDVDVDVDEDDDVDVDEDVAAAVDDDDDEDVEKNSASASDGGGGSGGAQSGDLVDFVFYKTTPEVVALVKQYTNDLFQRYRPKRIVSIDYQNVIDKVQVLACTEDGEHYADFDQQKAALLEYAFEQAAAVDKVNWKYIDGIYSNFAERGIETLEDAQEYEFKRQTGCTGDIMAKFFEE